MESKKTGRLAIATIILCKLMFPFPVLAQPGQQAGNQVVESIIANASSEELWEFFRWIMAQVENTAKTSPDLNAQTKERIGWMFSQAGQNFTLSKKIVGNTGTETIVALAKFENGKPGVTVNLGYLVEKYWQSYRSQTQLPVQETNDLTIMFSHEVIHLQHGPLVIEAMKTDPPLVAFEERRTWAQSVIEDIRPLVRKDQPVHQDYALAEILLRFCGDDMDCPAFKAFANTRTAPSK